MFYRTSDAQAARMEFMTRRLEAFFCHGFARSVLIGVAHSKWHPHTKRNNATRAKRSHLIWWRGVCVTSVWITMAEIAAQGIGQPGQPLRANLVATKAQRCSKSRHDLGNPENAAKL